jgi:hypothetical protein
LDIHGGRYPNLAIIADGAHLEHPQQNWNAQLLTSEFGSTFQEMAGRRGSGTPERVTQCRLKAIKNTLFSVSKNPFGAKRPILYSTIARSLFDHNRDFLNTTIEF